MKCWRLKLQLAGQRVHRPFALGQQFQHLEPVGAAECLADARELTCTGGF